MDSSVAEEDIQQISLKPKLICSHVTAVKFILDFIAVGEGNTLSLYDMRTLKKLTKVAIFKGCSIHGISVDFQDDKLIRILAFGAKSIRAYCFLPKEKSVRFLALTEEHELEDWIHDVQWLTYSSSSQTDLVAIALAHNSLMLWNWKTNKVHQHFHSREKCIIYSAKILGHDWDNIILAAGTVFKEVLLWSPYSKCQENSVANERKTPLHRLRGHQGVIFSVTFNYKLKLLSSTSDDRTLRLWKFILKSTGNSFDDDTNYISLEQWSNGEFHPVHVLYAHESRVWQSVILNSCIISVGEDASICFWSHDGGLIKREKCHKGGSIWCLDVHERNLIAVTGGSDSGILLWNIKHISEPGFMVQASMPNSVDELPDFPRKLSLLTFRDKCVVLVMTDQGKLMTYDGQHQQWKEIFCSPAYSSYSVVEVSPTRNFILVGNICGKMSLFVFKDSTYEIHHENEWQVHDGKVNSIHCASKDDDFVVTCGLLGDMKLWQLQQQKEEMSLVLKRKLHLPKNKHHWWSSVAVLILPANFLVVGDRVGSLFFYSEVLDQNDKDEKMIPHSSYCHIHGKNGVTDIQYDGKILYTAGRDGRVLSHELSEHGVSLLHAVKAPNHMEWIGKILLVNDDLVLLGFHTTLFLGWSTRLGRIVLNIECGGGHRSWDFSLNSNFTATFAAIKKKEIIVSQEELGFSLQNSCIKSGISGREFCCMHYLFSKDIPELGNVAILACGGEDNALQIIAVKNDSCSSSGIVVLHNMSGHLSNIRAITSCRMLHKNSCLMVSVGGRAQLMIWKIQCDSKVLCRELISDVLWSGESLSRKPWKDKMAKFYDPQMRYMDVAVWPSKFSTRDSEDYFVVTAGSDSFLRVNKFSYEDSKLLPVFNVQHGNHCIIRLSCAQMKTESAEALLLFAGANDGLLKVYQYHPMNNNGFKTLHFTAGKEQIISKNSFMGHCVADPHYTMKFHQSGINALDVKQFSGDHWLVCSGGDDNSLSMALLWARTLKKHDDCSEFPVLATGAVKCAHAAQITGVKILLEKFVVSVSIDQRVNIWSWAVTGSTINLQLLKSKMTSIPDVANMEIFWNEHSESWALVICGEGTEVFSLTLPKSSIS